MNKFNASIYIGAVSEQTLLSRLEISRVPQVDDHLVLSGKRNVVVRKIIVDLSDGTDPTYMVLVAAA